MFKGITFEAVDNFFDEYDYHGSTGWLTEMTKCIQRWKYDIQYDT